MIGGDKPPPGSMTETNDWGRQTTTTRWRLGEELVWWSVRPWMFFSKPGRTTDVVGTVLPLFSRLPLPKSKNGSLPRDVSSLPSRARGYRNEEFMRTRSSRLAAIVPGLRLVPDEKKNTRAITIFLILEHIVRRGGVLIG